MALSFDVAPYYDDFATSGGAQDNNYMRILFRPGKAVQARELTQLQSILQNQIKAFGNHIFQDGSPVFGGHISLDTSVVAISLQQQYANVDINLSDFLVGGNGTLIINASGSTTVKAVVIATDTTGTYPTIIVKYLTGNKFANGDVIQVASGLQTQAQLVTSNASVGAASASINEGIFYSGGFFVKVSPQTIVLDSTTTKPTYRVGLEISESIVDEVSDTRLLDPAQGSFNYQAPGATRYQYKLNLAKRLVSSIDDSAFYELMRVENGLITKQVDYPIYADLDKTLARRTFDQAGDFTVRPFIITPASDPANSAQYTLVIDPGKAYVKGFEFETVGTQKIFSPKARSTNTITDYGMSLEFGNILTVANVFGGNATGIFDITNYQQADLHCVQTANANTLNVNVYNATKVGTSRVRDIEYLGLGSFYAYVTEINITPNTFISTAGNANSITMPVNFSTTVNAYLNVAVSVNTAGIIDSRTIINYTGAATKVAFLDRPLSVNANATSNITLNWGIKDTQALTYPPTTFAANVYYMQNATSALYTAMDISASGRDVHGNTVLTDTQFNRLIFPLPQNYVAQNTITNANFYHRKNLWSQTFTSGNLSITSGSGLGTGETIPYGFTNAFLPDNTANTNVLIIVRDKQSSNRANGEIINFNRGSVAAGNGVNQIDSTHMTLVTGSSAAFIGDVIFTVQVTNAAAASVARRTKDIRGNASNTVLLSTDRYTNGTAVIGTTPAPTVFIDSANGMVWFTSNTAMAMAPGANQSLYVADVFNLIKVYDSGNTAFAPNVANVLLDITSNYYVNSGQRDNYYDHASLVLKAGAAVPRGQTVVMLQYYNHDAVVGFFDADSYSGLAYTNGQIPYYNSPKFGTFSLRDSIDFRPTRTIGSSANVNTFNLSGLKIPQPDHSMTLSFQFYLPRIDKLLLSKDKNFRIKQGTPAQYPTPPADNDDSMTLYVITLPAYTSNPKEIGIKYVENKRYTMRDIGALDKRIQQLEYYSSLSVLESQATNEKILYNDNVTAKDQYGIIADDFGGFTIADNKNRDLRCFLSQGSLSAYKFQQTFETKFQSSAGGSYVKNDKTYCLAFTETPAITSNTATTYISVQPFLFGQFKGHCKLTPETDPGFSPMPPIVTLPPETPIERPPVPAPPAAPTIPVQEPTPPEPVVVSTLDDYENYEEYWAYPGGYGRAGWIRIGRNSAGYGLVNPVKNWYGRSISGQDTVSQITPLPNLGTSIQLSPGAKLSQGTAVNIQGAGNLTSPVGYDLRDLGLW